MMMLKLQRVDIIQEREEKLKELEKLTGETMKRKPVPDYLVRDDISEEKENSQQIYTKMIEEIMTECGDFILKIFHSHNLTY